MTAASTPSKPAAVGIAGASCSGKTTLATALAGALPDAVVLSMDAYYRDLRHTPAAARRWVNFDAPEALDTELLQQHVEALLQGNAVDQPVYDFATHTRRSASWHLAPRNTLIVEGLYALAIPALLRRYRLRVFVETPDRVCLQRRSRRDAAERGRSAADVERQYTTQTRPMYRQHIAPSRARADLVLDGRQPVATNLQQLLDALATADPATGTCPQAQPAAPS